MPPRRKRRHPLRRTLIVLVVLVGLFLAADFGMAAIAEYEISQKMRSALDLNSDPQVTIHGFPFITQALAGDYSDISIDADGIHLNNGLHDVQVHAELNNVHVALHDVLSGSVTTVPIDHIVGTVGIRSDDVIRKLQSTAIAQQLQLSQLTISPASMNAVNTGKDDNPNQPQSTTSADGKTAGVKLTATANNIVGKNTKITVYGLISLVNGKIELAPKHLGIDAGQLGAELPESLTSQLLGAFDVTLVPGKLPMHVVPTGVTVGTGIVMVTGTADNVTLDLRSGSTS